METRKRKYKKQPKKKEVGTLLEPHFVDEDKAREYLEAMRWPDGAVCPHCGLVGEAYLTYKTTDSQN